MSWRWVKHGIKMELESRNWHMLHFYSIILWMVGKCFWTITIFDCNGQCLILGAQQADMCKCHSTPRFFRFGSQDIPIAVPVIAPCSGHKEISAANWSESSHHSKKKTKYLALHRFACQTLINWSTTGVLSWCPISASLCLVHPSIKACF